MIGDHRRRVVILGAAGRDFHNFNRVYRNDYAHEVIAFTATQIPGIAKRRYPPSLAGPHYPQGIPIHLEEELAALCRERHVDDVVFAYSDVAHADVMHKASIALAAGANFVLLGPRETMLKSNKPVISVCAVRTGAGKSQVSRWLTRLLGETGLRVAVLRHPMPYGDLDAQAVQRFASRQDLLLQRCTLEEREEYEPHIVSGSVVFAGVDYAHVLAAAEQEADIIVWDGGNNDFPFVQPDLAIALVDALRPGQSDTHHPGETVLRMADAIVIAKSNGAPRENIDSLRQAVGRIAPRARVVHGASNVTLDDAPAVKGKRVVVVDDGPTLTHGGMSHGAGLVAARAAGAAEIVDPRPYARGTIAGAYEAHAHLGATLPALGYSGAQLADLAATIEAARPDVVVAGTPVDLAAVLEISVPVVRARYDYDDMDSPGLRGIVEDFLSRHARS